jgi:hypothetical protein
MRISTYENIIHSPKNEKKDTPSKQTPSQLKALVLEDIITQLTFASKLDKDLCTASIKKGLKIQKSSGDSLRVNYCSTALATTSSNSPSTKVLNKTELFEELVGSVGDVFIRNGEVSYGDRRNPIPNITRYVLFQMVE